MPIALRLDDARTDLISLASLEGQVTVTGRHSPTSLNRLLNRKYRALRSRVSQLGLPQLLQSSASQPLPAQLAGEDYIEVTLAGLVAEVVGVDVRVFGEWRKLDAVAFEQRRDPGMQWGNRGRAFFARGQVAPSGVGWWCVNKAPAAVAATSITAGTLALFPPTLSGEYKIHSIEAWTDITTDSQVFLLYEAWDEWLLNAAAMALTQRDKNKTDVFTMARDAWMAADALIEASAARLQRGGMTSPSSYNGIEL